MEATLTIQEFSVLLSQRQDDDWLSQLMRALMTLEKPEDVQRILTKGPHDGAGWQGWG